MWSVDPVVESVGVLKVLALVLHDLPDELKRVDLRSLFQLVEEELFDADHDL